MIFDNLEDWKLWTSICFYITTLIIFTIINYSIGFNNINFNLPDYEGLRDIETLDGKIIEISKLEKLFNSFYYTLITQSTVGYGEIHPKSRKARIISCIHTLVFYTELIYILALL